MAAFTIFNVINAVLAGAVTAAVGAIFGKECAKVAFFVGAVVGFVFMWYPIGIAVWVHGRVKRYRADRRDEEDENGRI